jgi:glucose/arabinose dehydrogenase
MCLAALLTLAVVFLAVALAGGGDGDAGSSGDPAARHGRGALDLTATALATATATPAPTPTATPTPAPGVTAAPTAAPTPTATPVPPPKPAPTPVAGGYRLTQALPSANFGRMVAFALIPGASNQAVIVTQGGKIYRISLSGGAPSQYGDLSARVIDFNAENEGGLLGLAFSPNFQSDHRVYLYFTSNDCGSGAARCDVLARYSGSNADINEASEVVLLEIDDFAPNHNGGQVLFGPDGYLYLAPGDGGGGGDPQENAQNINRLQGKVLRLDVLGQGFSIPPDNPFVNKPGHDLVYAYGFRNPWRFSFDRQSGALWLGDVGQNEWEEVDRVVKGGNHGWDCYEGFAPYEPSGCPSSGFVAPRAVYSHDEGCSVTGGYVYRGPSMPELDGWYVYGDFCSGKIWAVNTVGSAPPVLLADTGLPIASFGEMPDGELLVLTFANAVYRLERR